MQHNPNHLPENQRPHQHHQHQHQHQQHHRQQLHDHHRQQQQQQQHDRHLHHEKQYQKQVRFDENNLDRLKRYLAMLNRRILDVPSPRPPIQTLETLPRTQAQLEPQQLEVAGAARGESLTSCASVLVPLCNVDGEASLLFTKRSDSVGTHKGHVCFPGGKCDENDPDLIATALREFHEELGVALSRGQVLGCFHDAISITHLRVTPVLAFLGDLDVSSLTPCEHEIKDVFALSLRQLKDPQYQSVQTFDRRGLETPSSVPSKFRLRRYTAGPYPIWGLTAHFVENLLKELFSDPVLSVPHS